MAQCLMKIDLRVDPQPGIVSGDHTRMHIHHHIILQLHLLRSWHLPKVLLERITETVIRSSSHCAVSASIGKMWSTAKLWSYERSLGCEIAVWTGFKLESGFEFEYVQEEEVIDIPEGQQLGY